MIEVSTYCSCVMKKYFNKEFVMMTEENDKDFESPMKCRICDGDYLD